MATLLVQQSHLRQSRSPSPMGAGVTLDASKFKKSAVPNKHIPYCPPGTGTSGRSSHSGTQATSAEYDNSILRTVLQSPKACKKLLDEPRVYGIDISTLAAAERQIAMTPLPDPKLVFPWLHGLHPENQLQLAFFMARRKHSRKTPSGIRCLTIVKASGDLSKAKIKGAVLPEEILAPAGPRRSSFPDMDPKEGFSVRNFHIQVAKLATISDIVIYRDEHTSKEVLRDIAKQIALAQRCQRQKCIEEGYQLEDFNTFVVTTPFHEIEQTFPELIAIDSAGKETGQVVDFSHMERQEMCAMTKATEIADNIWLGPSPDPVVPPSQGGTDESMFDILIEAADGANMPDAVMLEQIARTSETARPNLEFPSSGSLTVPMWSHTDVDGLLSMCKWMYELANDAEEDEIEDSETEMDEDGDVKMQVLRPNGKKFLIHCADGYTESSLLALTYFMFVNCIPVHEAWTRLHCEKKRNFFAYHTDVALLKAIQPRILQESPMSNGASPRSPPKDPEWLSKLDGSLPSRLLPYLYLGNLAHANNPELLLAMGIKQILSVGEPVRWTQEKLGEWGHENLLYIDRIQDNGCDSLTEEFSRCLDFIRKGKENGTATLVHCRVGVSRSATICIAEVMASTGKSFPRAYCFVRARRLNVIIQPHLRFAYELLKWEEKQRQLQGLPLRRELEWATISNEIAAMNKPYTR